MFLYVPLQSRTMLCPSAKVIVFVFLFCLHFASPLNFSLTSVDCWKNGIACGGDANSHSGSIQLNKIRSNSKGRAIYMEAVQLRDSTTGILTDFTTHFSFTIDTLNAGPYHCSDGFAFYISPVGYEIPPDSAGPYLGLFNVTNRLRVPQNHIVLVEFDTWPNNTTDIETYDPPVQHVGINNNSLRSFVYAEEDFGKHSGMIGNAWITYNGNSHNLSVLWSFDGYPMRSLSLNIDLSFLPEMVTIGFSGATGSSPERNIIHSWDFSPTLNSIVVTPRKQNKKVVIIAAFCSFVFVLLVVPCSWFIIKRIRKHDQCGTVLDFDLHRLTSPERFSHQELVVATSDFAQDRKLGRGGSGQVYKGILIDSGQIVAVKRIFAHFEDSEKIFTNEVRIISCLKHRNIVRFMGWCHEKDEFFLVYEYLPKGSLDTHLFNQTTPLPWNVRYKITIGMATALHYLHEEADHCVLHRDIKPANILLDMDFSTKLGDFGIARVVDPMSSQRTKLVGTLGYLAPEYLNGGKPSKESDIFIFGVVVLEIACGRRTHLQDEEYHVPLCSWVWQLYVEGHILDAADEKLAMGFDVNEMTCLLILGLWCTHPNHKERPSIGQVIKVLQHETSLPMLARDRPRILGYVEPLPSLSTGSS